MTSDDELRRRLPAYLHRHAPPPPDGLLTNLLRQATAMPQRRRGMPFAPVGWWVAGAAAVAAVLVVLFWVRGGIPTQLPLPGTVATPPPSAPPSLTTITLPVSVRDKAIVILASDVMAKRLQALGIGNFTSSAGDDLRFTLPIPPSVERADVDAVLNTPGDVEWLDWPDDRPVPDVGSAVPDGIHALFSSSEVISARAITSNGQSSVDIQLAPVAAEAFAAYTEAHIGKPMPLAMDGRILVSPTIQSPISGGEVGITFGSNDEGLSAAALAAILQSGPLPPGWGD